MTDNQVAATSPADGSAPTVLVSTRSFSTGRRDLVGELAAAGLRAVRVATDHSPDQLLPELRTATAWIAGTAPVTADHLAAAPGLRVLARYGVGVESVDLVAAESAGVTVTNTPGANSEAVSEHTVALVFAALRRITDADARVRSGDWAVSRGRQLAGSIAAVIGFGRIGRGTATRLAALGCQVWVHDPFVDPQTIRAAGYEVVDLDRVRRSADVVALHAPGGALLVDRAWLADCRAGQLIVNTARADLVDETELAHALLDGRLFGYAADTLGSESRSDHLSPLLDPQLRDRVTITPHLGAQTVEAVDLMGSMAVADVLAVLAGASPAHPVHSRPVSSQPARSQPARSTVRPADSLTEA